MPPSDPGSFTNPAATHPAKSFPPLRPGQEHAWVQNDDASERPLATDPRPSRLVTSAALYPLRNFRPRPFDDPCNYLG